MNLEPCFVDAGDDFTLNGLAMLSPGLGIIRWEKWCVVEASLDLVKEVGNVFDIHFGPGFDDVARRVSWKKCSPLGSRTQLFW